MPIIRGPVRARDLRANMKELGDKEGMAATIEQLLDEHVQDRENMRELAAMVDRLMDRFTEMTMVGSALKDQIEDVKRRMQQGDAIDHGNQ